MEENFIIPALYSFSKDGTILILIGTHVDDLLYGYVEEVADLVKSILEHLIFGKDVTGSFRFCGREYSRTEDFGVCVTCKNNIEKILPISFVKGVRGPDSKATAAEIAQARSVIGSLAWITRQARPGLCYQTSR